jgi:hypothetical protein
MIASLLRKLALLLGKGLLPLLVTLDLWETQQFGNFSSAHSLGRVDVAVCIELDMLVLVLENTDFSTVANCSSTVAQWRTAPLRRSR